MSQRAQIPDPAGLQDARAVSLFRTIKSIIDSITGRLPNQPEIKTLGEDATFLGAVNKINEVIVRLQTGTPATSFQTELVDELISDVYVTHAALADTVTTNANLTGFVKSVGNATSVSDILAFAAAN